MKKSEITPTFVIICIAILIAAVGTGISINAIKVGRAQSAKSKILAQQIQQNKTADNGNMQQPYLYSQTTRNRQQEYAANTNNIMDTYGSSRNSGMNSGRRNSQGRSQRQGGFGSRMGTGGRGGFNQQAGFGDPTAFGGDMGGFRGGMSGFDPAAFGDMGGFDDSAAQDNMDTYGYPEGDIQAYPEDQGAVDQQLIDDPVF